MGRDFRKLGIWQVAYSLVLHSYKLLHFFPQEESRNLCDQVRRAATSIPLNIAEGAASRSNKVFLSHLNYAYGSAKELDVLFLLGRDLRYISVDDQKAISQRLERFKSKCYLFMRSVEKEIEQGKKNYTFNPVS